MLGSQAFHALFELKVAQLVRMFIRLGQPLQLRLCLRDHTMHSIFIADHSFAHHLYLAHSFLYLPQLLLQLLDFPVMNLELLLHLDIVSSEFIIVYSLVEAGGVLYKVGFVFFYSLN